MRSKTDDEAPFRGWSGKFRCTERGYEVTERGGGPLNGVIMTKSSETILAYKAGAFPLDLCNVYNLLPPPEKS